MALPLLALIPLAATGAYGLFKGGKALVDNSTAGDINDSAQNYLDKANRVIKTQRDETNQLLEDYGRKKLRAFDGAISDFLSVFGRLKNVELQDSPELERLKLSPESATMELRKDYELLTSTGLGVASGITGGAAVAFGAYNGTMLLASAGTGTAISTLSGAAATNATLAWLGGGTLAAGGAGVAGGMLVLGGLVAAPALAVTGFIMGNKAEEALANARSNREKARTIYEEALLTADGLKAIEEVTRYADKVFSKVTGSLRRSVADLQTLIDYFGTDYSKFDDAQKAIVFRSVKFAQLIKALIDTPIMDENGKLLLTTQDKILSIEQSI